MDRSEDDDHDAGHSSAALAAPRTALKALASRNSLIYTSTMSAADNFLDPTVDAEDDDGRRIDNLAAREV